MKFLDTSFASDSSQQPLKSVSVDFMQSGTKEIAKWLTYGEFFDNSATTTFSDTIPYVIYGLIPTVIGGGPPTYNWTDGAVLYGNEIYRVNGFTISTYLTDFYATASVYYAPTLDPTEFSDFVTHNVHKDTTLNINTTSGLFNLNALVYKNPTTIQVSDGVAPFIPETWNTLSGFGSGWVTPGAGTGVVPRYSKTGYQIFFNGEIKSSGYATNSICTIPSGYRPTQHVRIVCNMYNVNTDLNQVATVNISPAGVMFIRDAAQLPTASGWYLDLSAINYLSI